MNTIEKDRKISIICHSVAICVGIILMILASFYDLKLSQAIGDQSNFFGQLFAIIGEYPSYFMISICGTIFYYNFDLASSKTNRILIKIGGAIVVWFGIFLYGMMGTKLVKLDHNTLWSIFNGLFYGALCLLIGHLIPKETMHRLLKFAVFSITFIIVAIIFMRLFKFIWCRMRYRDMLKAGSFEGFSNWWQPMIGRDKNPEYRYTSFPSGHSSSLAHLYLICVLCDILPSWKSKKWLKPTLYAVVTTVVSVGAFSRIVNCAHFLSDIVIGVFLTYGIFYLLKWIFFKNGKYEYELKGKLSMESDGINEGDEK